MPNVQRYPATVLVQARRRVAVLDARNFGDESNSICIRTKEDTHMEQHFKDKKKEYTCSLDWTPSYKKTLMDLSCFPQTIIAKDHFPQTIIPKHHFPQTIIHKHHSTICRRLDAFFAMDPTGKNTPLQQRKTQLVAELRRLRAESDRLDAARAVLRTQIDETTDAIVQLLSGDTDTAAVTYADGSTQTTVTTINAAGSAQTTDVAINVGDTTQVETLSDQSLEDVLRPAIASWNETGIIPSNEPFPGASSTMAEMHEGFPSPSLVFSEDLQAQPVANGDVPDDNPSNITLPGPITFRGPIIPPLTVWFGGPVEGPVLDIIEGTDQFESPVWVYIITRVDNNRRFALVRDRPVEPAAAGDETQEHTTSASISDPEDSFDGNTPGPGLEDPNNGKAPTTVDDDNAVMSETSAPPTMEDPKTCPKGKGKVLETIPEETSDPETISDDNNTWGYQMQDPKTHPKGKGKETVNGGNGLNNQAETSAKDNEKDITIPETPGASPPMSKAKGKKRKRKKPSNTKDLATRKAEAEAKFDAKRKAEFRAWMERIAVTPLRTLTNTVNTVEGGGQASGKGSASQMPLEMLSKFQELIRDKAARAHLQAKYNALHKPASSSNVTNVGPVSLLPGFNAYTYDIRKQDEAEKELFRARFEKLLAHVMAYKMEKEVEAKKHEREGKRMVENDDYMFNDHEIPS
ncbi:hypothetical protein V8F20_011490 [Naviculisporaceae sp. PSN 640]